MDIITNMALLSILYSIINENQSYAIGNDKPCVFDEGKAGDRDHKQLLDMDRGLENVG